MQLIWLRELTVATSQPVLADPEGMDRRDSGPGDCCVAVVSIPNDRGEAWDLAASID